MAASKMRRSNLWQSLDGVSLSFSVHPAPGRLPADDLGGFELDEHKLPLGECVSCKDNQT